MNRLVSTYELDPVSTQNDDLRFRVEIVRSSRGYQARLLRWETFRLEPSSSGTQRSDECVLVEDSFWDWTKQQAESEVEALTQVLAALEAQLQSEPFSDQIRQLLR